MFCLQGAAVLVVAALVSVAGLDLGSLNTGAVGTDDPVTALIEAATDAELVGGETAAGAGLGGGVASVLITLLATTLAGKRADVGLGVGVLLGLVLSSLGLGSALCKFR